MPSMPAMRLPASEASTRLWPTCLPISTVRTASPPTPAGITCVKKRLWRYEELSRRQVNSDACAGAETVRINTPHSSTLATTATHVSPRAAAIHRGSA